MNTQKAVYNRLFSKEEKTELETHKVELGIIDDLNKALEESEEISKLLKEGKGLVARDEKFLAKDLKEADKRQAIAKKAADVFFKLQDDFGTARVRKEEADKKVDSIFDDINDLRNRIASYEKKTAPLVKKAQKQIAIFEKNISKANKMAQDLGVKLPIAKFEKAQDKLKTLI